MDTIVTPANIQQLARMEELLRRAGIGYDQVQRLITDVAHRNLVTQVWLNGHAPVVELPDKFDKAAMERFIAHVFKQQLERLRWAENDPAYVRVDGLHPMELATTEVMKSLLKGLSESHVQVAMLRGGLIDGQEVKPAEVAKRLGTDVRWVSKARNQVRQHVLARQRAEYPLLTFNRKMEAAHDRIDELGLTVRTYNGLLRHGVRSITALTKLSAKEVLGIRYLGDRELAEIEAALAKRGLGLSPS